MAGEGCERFWADSETLGKDSRTPKTWSCVSNPRTMKDNSMTDTCHGMKLADE